MQEQMSTETAKSRAKERDDYRCQFCGITSEQHKDEYGRDLHAHHIIKERDGGVADDNGVDLLNVSSEKDASPVGPE